jgi:transposase
MKQDTLFIGLDVHKETIAVAVAEGSRGSEVRFMGTIVNKPEAIVRLVTKLAKREGELRFCYEAGPCGYAIHRQITKLEHECIVVAPSLTPIRPGDRVKTDRRDAVTLARLHRADELTAVWVPDEGHEAMRDLVRLRTAAMEGLRRARQQLQGFLLCESACKKDPLFGVIGIQTGPRNRGSTLASMIRGGRGWDAGRGDDCKDTPGVFQAGQADQGDLPGVGRIAEGRKEGDPLGGD